MFDLDALIRQSLTSGEPDPHVIARKLAREIPKERLGEILVRCLTDRVREVIRFERMAAHGTLNHPRKGVGESRAVAAAARLYSVGNEWKHWNDLTADDCEKIADQHAARAARADALAERFRTIAAHMRRVGAATIADLDLDVPEPAAA